MPDEAESPPPPAVSGPEETLDPIREQAHEETGLPQRVMAAESGRDAAERRVTALEARERELIERLARLQADFENFRRRAREEGAIAATRGKETVAKALLPALDNVERALTHSEDQGVRMVARQLMDALAGQGLVVLDPQNEAFDAKLHEAIAQEARDGVKAGTVLVVAEKGYRLDGRLLRPARVVVAS